MSAETKQPVEVLEQGTYEIIQARLREQTENLRQRLDNLNSARKEVFGSIETTLLGNSRLTTEYNCKPRDMVSIGSRFLFGFNIHMGLKSVTRPEDVFSIYRYSEQELLPDSLDVINDPRFQENFQDLYKYYKDTAFKRFSRQGPFLFMVFRVGKVVSDIKVFKWLVEGENLRYVDNRSESEYRYPSQHEFEWTRTHRDRHRSGRHPHVSIEDKVFVETVGGNLTVKIEDNTDDGEGVFSEPVVNADQTLDDAEIFYASLGNLILMKIRPYLEEKYRYFVFSQKTRTCLRMDGIEKACVLLPDDHGIIFSNGYFLQNGEAKVFENPAADMLFDRRVASPNGEDTLFAFHDRQTGAYNLLSYNLIEQTVEIPITCHGFTLFENGVMLVFRDSGESQKHHMVQFWRTPFTGSSHILTSEETTSEAHRFLLKLGNKDVVRAMAECRELITLVVKGESYADVYADLVRKSGTILDTYFWLGDEKAENLAAAVSSLRDTSKQALDEFEKVRRVRIHTTQEIHRVSEVCRKTLAAIAATAFSEMQEFVDNLGKLRTLRGETITLKNLRYADLPQIEGLEKEIAEALSHLSRRCVEFLLQPDSLDGYRTSIQEVESQIPAIAKVAEADELDKRLVQSGSELELLIDIVSNLKIDDTTQSTEIVDRISSLFAELNKCKALLRNRRQQLAGVEAAAEFNVQMKLLGQSVVNFLDLAETPERCDESLSKLMVQLEDLEGKVAGFDEFLDEIGRKREEIYGAFESRKIRIVEDRNRQVQSLERSAERILKSVANKVSHMATPVEINGYFASDLMVDKARSLIKQLRTLGDQIKADGIEAKLKALQEEGQRQLKDKLDLYEEGQDVIKLGRHRFSVNRQPLELTTVLKDDEYWFHLGGTRYFEKIEDSAFLATRPVWVQTLVSENDSVYRGEYLAWQFLKQARAGRLSGPDGALLSWVEASGLRGEFLMIVLHTFMAGRYSEGYVKGQHDVDAARILEALLPMVASAGLMVHTSAARTAGLYWWHFRFDPIKRDLMENRLRGHAEILSVFPDAPGSHVYREEIQKYLIPVLEEDALFLESGSSVESLSTEAAGFIFDWRISSVLRPPVDAETAGLLEAFGDSLRLKGRLAGFENMLKDLSDHPREAFLLARHWLAATAASRPDKTGWQSRVDESCLWALLGGMEPGQKSGASMQVEVIGMLGEHKQIVDGRYNLAYDDFVQRLLGFENETVPRFQDFESLRKQLSDEKSASLRLDEFKPRVLGSFVRNRLIDKVYLPLIGDNLAKQMGVVGDKRRTDLMGLLLLISPPGYGKTTLMEYVASRLGLVFMKINGPALGHEVTSLDPSQAPNASAAQEVDKLNLALEMGDNVMIYLDDIQHCHPEFLQKFISLCDGQRKMEGLWRGKTRTYDLRGRKVAVVMAGNPYTEIGETFRIPDMLANRADTYNLGDIIGENTGHFELSYIENAMTSNVVLQSLNNKSRQDLFPMLQLATNGSREGLEFEGAFSAEETQEIVGVLKKMIRARDVILKVNLEYIRSASQSDAYRSEPSFKLQGSYRNMNKIAEKILPVMNDSEFEALLAGHYEGESQTLTAGAEANLLKFKSLNGVLTKDEAVRWKEICESFKAQNKVKQLGGDAMGAMLGEVMTLGTRLGDIGSILEKGINNTGEPRILRQEIDLGWVEKNYDMGWDTIKFEMGDWIESPEFWKRVRYYVRTIQPIVQELEPLRRTLLETPIENWPAGEQGEKLEGFRQTMNRILWTYGGMVKLLRMAGKK